MGRAHPRSLVFGRALLAASSVVLTAGMSSGASAPAKAPEPELPAARVALEVMPAPAAGAPWRLRISNREDSPVRIAADPRLLILELTPPPTPSAKPKAAPAVLQCQLPADARPSTDEGRELVVPPSRTWSAAFDPLFYCFGARERAALVPGTTVRARFGWPVPPAGAKAKAPTPPFAAQAVGAGASKVAPAKALETDTFALTEATVPEIAAKVETTSNDPRVALGVPATLDVARGTEVSTTVTFTNSGDRPLIVLFRPNMIQFSVNGPHGPTTCGEPRAVASPIRELFTTVPAKGSTQTAVLVTATCPAGTFDDPGIYRVTPRFDTTNASGRAMGLSTWDGTVSGKTPLLVRVRSARTPDLARPAVD